MTYQATTPFGQRPVTAGLLEQAERMQTAPALPHINKWEIFRELTVAKSAYALTDRDLTVLNALLSFHQETNLSDNDLLIVFPSNVALSERAHGMAESTLRRHLAALVRAGVIRRNDSPNGKRFALKGPDGAREAAYGFDLRPLLVLAPEIARQAAEQRETEAQTKRKRIEASVILRDVAKLAEYALDQGQSLSDAFLVDLADAKRALRRKLALTELVEILGAAQKLLSEINVLVISDTKEMSGNDVYNERHHHNSNTQNIDSEPSLEKDRAAGVGTPTIKEEDQSKVSNIPFPLVVKACPDLATFSQRDLRDWSDLIHAAEIVRPMLGISPHAWSEAVTVMGANTAAITLGYILQRASDIQNPGGYLRSLTRKAQEHAFSSGPLVMSLLTPQGQG